MPRHGAFFSTAALAGNLKPIKTSFAPSSPRTQSNPSNYGILAFDPIGSGLFFHDHLNFFAAFAPLRE
jgi:hypothetical protein